MHRTLIGLFCLGGLVQGCTCTTNSLREERKRSPEIFSGTVTTIDNGLLVLTVDRVWKGKVHSEERVYIDAMCHPGPSGVKVGEALLVFANGRWSKEDDPGPLRGVFVLTGCTRTERLTVTKDTDHLGHSHPPSN